MVKKGPIGKVESFYIENHYTVKTSQELAKDLNRNIKTVENFISKIVQENAKESSMKAGDAFAYNNKGSTVMTENASSIADANKKVGPRYNKSCVTNIKK
tara:strand:+ start:1054 stop:1353 length:300 start_codon:yes stop_codon:yes gene_type:complete